VCTLARTLHSKIVSIIFMKRSFQTVPNTKFDNL